MMKKKSGKRFLSWLLAAVMIIALRPANAFAEPPTESSGNTEPAVTAYCPSSEGGTDVSVEGYDSSPAAETKNTPTEEPAKDTPAEEPAKDTPAEEPVKDTPAEEPVKESPVADKTTEDTPAQEGAVENSTDEKIIEDSTNEASAAELAGLTAMLGAPVPMELYAWQSYPVYVYGCFKHNDNYLAENAALYINGKEKAIEWNGDASKGEYYITFGKLTDATTEKPSRYQRYNYNEVPKWEINTNDIETRIAKGEVTLASKDIAGSAQKNGLATTGADVNKYVKGKWSGLKPRKGAEGFPETGTKWSWHIDGTINVYRVYYKSDDIGEPVKLPKESTYFLDDYTVRKMETSSQNYKFLGWEYKGRVYQDKETIEAPGEDITLTAKWAPKEKVYTVNYNWGSNAPEGVTLPTDNTPYNSEIEAKNAMDTTYVNGYEHKTTDGTYTFSGWTPSVGTTDYNGDKIVTPITFTGTWNFTPKPVWKLAYSWTGDVPNGVENVVLPTNSDVYYSEQDAIQHKDNSYTADTSFNANNGIYTFSGWSETPTSNTTTVDGIKTTTLTYTGSWNFTPSEIKTITGVLNTLVWKSFTAQYNYSTEGTFTATAKVMPVHPEINSYAAEVDESSDNNTNTPGTDNAKTFTGTVNLKTGETRAFNFSAGKGVADVLDPDTYYEVRVSEVEGNLSKVTYDTTKYILTFTTDRNAVVDYIWIAKEKDSENDHPELEPVEGTTITFHNIYTYKRHHSSSDGGNGGGKKEEKPTVEIKDDDALGLNNTDHFAYIVGYGNGEVRPQNSITRAEVAAIFFRLLEDDVRDANYTRQNKFTDVSNDAWYCSAVSTLSAMGIISGYPDATFRPNASITRAEFAAIATRFDVNGDKTPASFNDIAGHWAKDEIAVAANNGWVNGYEDGSFRPQNKITRAETMSLVNRVLNRKPETAEDLLENMTKWTDNADTNAWYYLAVQEATNSHYYEYKENSQYEKWTELRETRDWSELDK